MKRNSSEFFLRPVSSRVHHVGNTICPNQETRNAGAQPKCAQRTPKIVRTILRGKKKKTDSLPEMPAIAFA